MQVLVSVNSVPEVRLALAAGVTLIDLKDTSHGALAALDLGLSQAIVQEVQSYAVPPALHPVLLSATVGDDCDSPHALRALIEGRLKMGVHIIKLPETIWGQAVFASEIERFISAGAHLIAVLTPQQLQQRASLAFALQQLANAGYMGVMVDTVDKSASVVDVLAIDEINQFVTIAKALHLFVGVAGGLQLKHLSLLAESQADYLGFRGGLCLKGSRKSVLLPEMVHTVARQVSALVANLSLSQ